MVNTEVVVVMLKRYPVSRKCISDVLLESMNLCAINSGETPMPYLLPKSYQWPEIKHLYMQVQPNHCCPVPAIGCRPPVYRNVAIAGGSHHLITTSLLFATRRPIHIDVLCCLDTHAYSCCIHAFANSNNALISKCAPSLKLQLN